MEKLTAKYGLLAICEVLLYSPNLHKSSFSLADELLQTQHTTDDTPLQESSSIRVTDDGTKAARARLRAQSLREEVVVPPLPSPSTTTTTTSGLTAVHVGATHGILYQDWLICQESNCPICDSPTLEELETTLGHATPEMVFTAHRMVLFHVPTGKLWSFDARNALAACRSSTTLLVATAEEWSKGSIVPPGGSGSSGSDGNPLTIAAAAAVAASGASGGSPKLDSHGNVIPVQRMTHDWTFTSEYSGDTSQVLLNEGDNAATMTGKEVNEEDKEEKASDSGGGGGGSGSGGSGSSETDGSGGSDRDATRKKVDALKIPYEHLSKREPLLFHAKVPLYATELDDNGLCSFTVRLRLMPTCKWVVSCICCVVITDASLMSLLFLVVARLVFVVEVLVAPGPCRVAVQRYAHVSHVQQQQCHC